MEMDSDTEGTADTEVKKKATTETSNLSPLDPDSSKAKLFDMLHYNDESPLVGRYMV